MYRLAMPDSDSQRTVACVPLRSGMKASSSIFILTSAWPFSVSLIWSTVPMGRPATCTRLPTTSCEALVNRAWTV
jgi:hypothetical protein